MNKLLIFILFPIMANAGNCISWPFDGKYYGDVKAYFIATGLEVGCYPIEVKGVSEDPSAFDLVNGELVLDVAKKKVLTDAVAATKEKFIAAKGSIDAIKPKIIDGSATLQELISYIKARDGF